MRRVEWLVAVCGRDGDLTPVPALSTPAAISIFTAAAILKHGGIEVDLMLDNCNSMQLDAWAMSTYMFSKTIEQ